MWRGTLGAVSSRAVARPVWTDGCGNERDSPSVILAGGAVVLTPVDLLSRRCNVRVSSRPSARLPAADWFRSSSSCWSDWRAARASSYSGRLTPVANLLSREHERRADQYALAVTGKPEALASGLRRLAVQSLAGGTTIARCRMVVLHAPATIRQARGGARGDGSAHESRQPVDAVAVCARTSVLPARRASRGPAEPAVVVCRVSQSAVAVCARTSVLPARRASRGPAVGVCRGVVGPYPALVALSLLAVHRRGQGAGPCGSIAPCLTGRR